MAEATDRHNPSRRTFLKGLCALAVFQLAPGALRASAFPTLEEAMRNAFPEADRFEQKRAIAKSGQYEAITAQLEGRNVSRIFTYHRAERNDQLLGFAVEGAVLGKHKDIDYLIALSPQLTVSHIEILAYRESYGYQIKSQRFLKQFYGKDHDDPIRLNEEITNIATATISCRSMIRAVQEVLAYASVLLAEEALLGLQSSIGEADAVYATLQRSTHAMGTLLSVAAEFASEATLQAAFRKIRHAEQCLSRFDASSEIARLNATAGAGAFTLTPETFGLLKRCESYTRLTQGQFQPVAGGGLTRFPVGRRVALKPGASVDLGAVGKGYALDLAADCLKAAGVQRALLNFGGQLLAIGQWPIFVRETGELLKLADASLATTNTLERGKHLRGKPMRRSTGVIANTAEAADAFATGLHLLPEGTAQKIASDCGLRLLLA